jgi:alkaline phosphatase D
MRKLLFFVVFFISLSFVGFSQKLLISGPMLGYMEHREALIWLEVSPEVKKVEIRFQKQGKPETAKSVFYKDPLSMVYNPIKLRLENLDMNSTYEYSVWLNDRKMDFPFPTTLKTKKIWEWREPAPDFSFLVGSCFYINDTLYDRPGKPYGQDPRILETMGNMPSDFMLWTGDNLYLREADYSSPSGIDYRYSYNFRLPQMQKLRATRANFATWDDHDYGPNDSDGKYELKEYTLAAFKKYWGNKSFGESDNAGVYNKFRWSDCDFFVMDDRYHRSADDYPDSIGGKVNPMKQFYGRKQMEWLKNSLTASDGAFKFIISGGQMLNPLAKDKECLMAYTAEWLELMNFITDNKIKGVIFITGDRHFTEMIKYQPQGFYPLYEYTCSAVTSGVATINNKSPEFTNPMRVQGSLLMENNFGKITISGAKNERIATFETVDINGKSRWTFSVSQKDLKMK